MKILITTLLAFATLAVGRPAARLAAAEMTSLDAAVDTYEHLATVIIEVRKTEDSLVKGILIHHYDWAQHDLATAEGGKDTSKHLEAAATEISNIANEGDKRVQAIRQRLSKAGHTHISDADTKEDYMFINSKEKKALLDMAKKIAQMGDKATAAQVTAASKDLKAAFDKAIAPE